MVSGFSSVSFTLIDIVIFLLISWGAYKGYQKGFLTELLSIVFFIALLIGSFALINWGFSALSQQTTVGRFTKATHFCVFVTVYFIISIIISRIDRRMQDSSKYEVFEGVDSFVGLILGTFKYTFALSILAEMLTTVGIFNRAEMNNTVFYPMLTRLFDFFFEIGNAISPFIGNLVGEITRLLSK
jgi:membrane protein required for colicin V production